MDSCLQSLEWPAEQVEVHVGELMLVTPECCPERRLRKVASLLRHARETFGIDVVFVAQSIEGHQLVRAAGDGACECDALEETYGHRVLDERPHLPRPAGVPPTQMLPDFIALPVVGMDGSEYGTLCSLGYPFARWDGGDSSVEALQSLAGMVATAVARGSAAA